MYDVLTNPMLPHVVAFIAVVVAFIIGLVLVDTRPTPHELSRAARRAHTAQLLAEREAADARFQAARTKGAA